MEIIVLMALLVLVAPYIIMGVASIKIHKELKEVLNTPTDNLDLPTTL